MRGEKDTNMVSLGSARLNAVKKRFYRQVMDTPAVAEAVARRKNMVRRITRRELNADAPGVSELNADSALFHNNNCEFDENQAVGKINCNSIAGYVPYVGSQTSIIIHNFLSKNYAVRKPVLLRLSLVQGTEVMRQAAHVLRVGETRHLDLEAVFGSASGDIAVVEAFSPFIRRNHGGHDGQFRFWGYYQTRGIPGGIVHSMPLDDGLAYVHAWRSSVRKLPAALIEGVGGAVWQVDEAASHLPFTELEAAGDPGQVAARKRSPYGFNYVTGGFGPTADLVQGIWHDGPPLLGQVSGGTAGDGPRTWVRSGVYIPEGMGRRVRVLLDPREFGGANCPVRFLLRRAGQSICVDERVLGDRAEVLSLAAPESLSGSGGYLLEMAVAIADAHLARLPGPYFHAFYGTEDSLGDNVHSHCTWWDHETGGYVHDGRTSRWANNCLKFCPVILSKDVATQMVVHLAAPPAVAPENRYFDLRLMLGSDSEIVRRFRVEGEAVKVIDFDDFATSVGEGPLVGIAQIESPYVNFDASFMVMHRHSESVAVDHLTGG